MSNLDLIRVYIELYRLLFRRHSGGTDDDIVRRCLLSKVSYRLSEGARHDRLIGVRLLARAMRRTLDRVAFKWNDTAGDLAVLDVDFRLVELEKEYLHRQGNENVSLFLGKEYLGGFVSLPGIPFRLLLLFLFSLPLAAIAVFSSKRSSMALLITEMTETAALLSIMRQKRCKRLFDLIPYEKDGNFLSLVLRKRGIHVTKIPSPGPLYLHNSMLIADRLILSNQYQFEEYEIFKKSGIRVKAVEKWLPESAFNYIERYTGTSCAEPEKGTLAYYSHGSWVRRKEDHARTRLNIANHETAILGFLGTFLSKFPGYKLTIYVHPREKAPGLGVQVKEFYEKHLGSTAFELSKVSGNTSSFFDRSDIAVCAYSSVIYERLFSGFKTIFGLPGTFDFPMASSTLNRIVFREYDEMEALILKSAATSRQAFFSEFGLEAYKFSSYPYFAGEN